MGEATRRKSEYNAWIAGLDNEERHVVETAYSLYKILPPAACYRASLFLQYHLKKCYNIEGNAVIGFVNDGTDNLYSSHAWYVFQDKMTDIAISRPMNPSIQNAGHLIIHGNIIKAGWEKWNYHTERPTDASEALQSLRSIGHGAYVDNLENIHSYMKNISNNADLIREYLDNAPDKLSYDVIVSKL